MAKCSKCGKEFDGYYNWDAYVYRKGEKIYCSWKCYREDTKHRKTKNNFATK